MNVERKVFAFLLLGGALLLLSPLLLPVAMGAVLAVLLLPWLKRLEKRRLSTGASAALLSVGTLLVLVIPAILLVILGARMGLEQLQVLKSLPHAAPGTGPGPFEKLLEVPFFKPLVELITSYFPVESQEIARTLGEVAQGVGVKMAAVLGEFLTQLPSYALGMVVMIVATYFFLVDGRRLARFIREHSFYTAAQTEMLSKAFVGSCRSVILASVASGFAQSLLFSLACLVVGRSNVPLIGFAIFFASFVPLVGSAPVTFGVALHQLLGVGKPTGIALLVVAAVVAVVDNLVRPAVMRGASNLHPLLGFVAVFGGLQLMGFAGVFLGPILMAVAVTMIEVLTLRTRDPG